MSITQKVFSSRALNIDADTYVGEAGRLFYAQTTGTGIAPVLKYSDGFTAGGLPLSGSSLTFSSDTPPNNPHDGLLWWNTTDGRLYIYYDSTWVDASPDIQGAVTEIIAGPGISVNTSTGAVTITAIGGTGYTGSQGGIGYTGSVGSAPIGYTGSVGEVSTVPGYTGSAGETGYTGSTGETGYTGSVGELGYTGSVGELGYTGSVGETGYTGSTGETGYTGSTGETGYTGSAGWQQQPWQLNSGTFSAVLTDNGLLTLTSGTTIYSTGDITIQTLSTQTVNIRSEFHVHSAEAQLVEPIFRVLNDGQIRMLVPAMDNLSAAVMIIGSTTTNFVAPQNTGVMEHLTGQLGTPTRVYSDGVNSYAAYVGRRYDGTSTNPQAITTTSGSQGLISRIGATPYVGAVTNGGWPQLTTSRIEFRATEDQTPTDQGNQIEFWTTPIGTSTIHQDISINSLGIRFRDGSYQDTAAIPLTQRGTANGVATLGPDSKVIPEQLPTGAIFYKGAWDAGTNTPFLFANSGTYVEGWEYSVSNTGTQTINTTTGAVGFYPGDYIIYNGEGWDRIPGNSGSVISFNGRNGDVLMTTTDVINVLTPGSILASKIDTPYITINPGAGLSGGGQVNLGSTVNIANAGVTSIINGGGLTVSNNTGSVTVGWTNSAGYLTSATVNTYVTPFNTSTLVAHAVIADNITGGYVSSITAGTGTKVSTSTGAITVWNTVPAYSLPTASTSTLGGVKVDGSTVSINGSGVISAIAAVNYYPVTRDVNLVGDTTFNFSFATDVYIRMKYDTALTIGFQDMTPGKVVTIVAVNTSNGQRVITSGLAAGHTTNNGAATISVSTNRIATLRYMCFGTSSSDVYCEVSYQ